MKLRQKLAVVLASAMVVSAVPVVTMAASNNGMLRETLKVKKGETFYTHTTAGGVQIQFKDAWQSKQEVFYLTLTNAEWNKEALVNTLAHGTAYDEKVNTYVLQGQLWNEEEQKYEGSLLVDTQENSSRANANTITFDGDKTIKVTLGEGNVNTNTILNFPLLVTAKGGDAKVKLEKGGSTSTITDGEWVFATTADKKLSFTAADAEVIYETGVLADVTFAENFSGAFSDEDVAEIAYEIQNGDYEFDFPSTLDKVENVKLADGEYYTQYNLTDKFFNLSYGFVGEDTIKVTAYVNKEDKGICVFKIEANEASSDSIGKITLTNIPVRNDAKEIEEGDLLVDIRNFNSTEALGNSADDVKLAKVVAYSTYIEMKDEKPVEIVAGRTETIEFTLGENIDDSIVGDRELEIVLDKDAHFNYTTGAELYVETKGLKHGIVKDQTEYELEGAKVSLIQSIKVDKENNNKLIVKLNPKAQINEVKDEFTLKLDVCVPVASKDEEKVTITASGRALENECSTTAVTIKNPFDVKMEELRVKVGLQNQVGGKVTITETEKAMFMKGNMNLAVVDPATGKVVDGISFYGKDFVTFETSADIKKADLQTVNTNGVASIKINRQSKAASTIDLSDFHVTVDRTVPEGKYDLVIYGSAIDEHADVDFVDQDQADLHRIVVKDFFVVGTPNTEDITSNGLRRGTVTFAIGESKYVANGIEYTMEGAASYIQDPGFTMVPVRYVAEAFGVSKKDILFSAGTATIFAGERTIQLTSGSDIAIVNGAQIKMETKVVIKDGRTYAPIGEIATILGITKEWKPETKTAVFINE